MRKGQAQSLICVECGRPVDILYKQYSKGNIRLGRCDGCNSVTDQYIEYEFVLVAIDLALHRVQAYRHLLFNRKPFNTCSFKGGLWQIGLAMAVLHAYLRSVSRPQSGMHIGGAADTPPEASAAAVSAAAAAAAGTRGPILLVGSMIRGGQLLLDALVEHAAFALGVLAWLRWFGRPVPAGGPAGPPANAPGPGPGPGPGPHAVPTAKVYMAVVYPLFFRLLAAFVMIWDRQVAAVVTAVGLLVLTMQHLALTTVLAGASAGVYSGGGGGGRGGGGGGGPRRAGGAGGAAAGGAGGARGGGGAAATAALGLRSSPHGGGQWGLAAGAIGAGLGAKLLAQGVLVLARGTPLHDLYLLL